MKETIEKLLTQQFDMKIRGYDKDQVDDFLDEVIEDIEKLQKRYSLLLDEKKILEKNNFELKMKMLEMKSKLEDSARTSTNNTPPPSNNQANIQSDRLTQLQNQARVQKLEEQKLRIQKASGQNYSSGLGQAVTHEDSKANDYTLQNRIEQLEQEINNIKNFND